jgi:lysophospholipase L1-like esterase
MHNSFVMALFILVSAIVARAESPKLELRDGDRIALIGGTFVERDWTTSYLETALTAWNPDKRLVVRNLGWSGDTVWGDARAGFSGRAAGFKQLQDRVAEVKPTLILVFYGTNESYAGAEGLNEFVAGLSKLLDVLKANNPRHVVLFSPLAHEKLDPPLPDPTTANKNLELYGNAIKQVADQRGCNFIDLFAISNDLYRENKDTKFTNNGMHLNDAGAQAVSMRIARALQQPATIVLNNGEALRQAIIAKNQLFFHRWRPQNDIYIFGMRKQEQGRNAVEIPQFDPLIEKAEAEIHTLAQPKSTP